MSDCEQCAAPSINWGYWGEVGIVAEVTRLTAEVEKLRAALEIARTYIFVSTFELSVHPEQATRDLTVVDAVLSTSQPEPQKENSMTDITIPSEALEAIRHWPSGAIRLACLSCTGRRRGGVDE